MKRSKVGQPEVEPILVSLPQAAQMLGRGVTALYTLIGEEKIRAVKSDGRTLIVVASLYEYVNRLPPAKINRYKRPPKRIRKLAEEAAEAERLRELRIRAAEAERLRKLRILEVQQRHAEEQKALQHIGQKCGIDYKRGPHDKDWDGTMKNYRSIYK